MDTTIVRLKFNWQYGEARILFYSYKRLAATNLHKNLGNKRWVLEATCLAPEVVLVVISVVAAHKTFTPN